MANTVTLYHPHSGTEVSVSEARARTLRARGYSDVPRKQNTPPAPATEARGPGRPPKPTNRG